MLRIFAPASLLVTSALLLAACGGSNNNTSTTGNSHAKNRADVLAFARCMRTNGVPNFPDPGQGGGGGFGIQASQGPNGQTLSINGVSVSAPAFHSAQAKCQKYMPQGPPLTAAQVNQIRAGALAMAKCMRSHGVTNFPDPVVTAGPNGHGVQVRIGVQPGGSGGQKFNLQSPAFQAAQKTCQQFMAIPGFRKGPGG